MTGTRLIDAGQSPNGWSKIGAAFKCLQKYSFAEIMQLSTSDKAPLIRGSLGHVGAAHWLEEWRCHQHHLASDILPWQDAMRQWCRIHPQVAGWAFLDEMISTVEKWIQRRVEPPGEVLAVEWVVSGWVAEGPRGLALYTEEEVRRFNLQVIYVGSTPVGITRRLDVLFRVAREIVIWDHKFRNTRIGDKSIIAEYEADGQFSASRLLIKALGFNAPVVINAVRVGTGEFVTPTLPSCESKDERFSFRLWKKYEEIERWKSVDPTWWPTSDDEQVCRGRYGDCEYKSQCMHGRP